MLKLGEESVCYSRRSLLFWMKRGDVEFSKYTIYSKYVNATVSTISCNYKISSSASFV